MRARRANANQHIPNLEFGGTRQDVVALQNADNCPGHVKFAGGVNAGHFGGFSAQESHARLFAGLGYASDHLGGLLRIEFGCSKIVHKEQRAGALDKNIIDTMIDDVVTNAAKTASRRGEFDLRSDAIG